MGAIVILRQYAGWQGSLCVVFYLWPGILLLQACPAQRGKILLFMIYFNSKSSMAVFLRSICSVNTQVFNASSVSGTVWDSEDTEMKAQCAPAWSSDSSGKTGQKRTKPVSFHVIGAVPYKGPSGLRGKGCPGTELSGRDPGESTTLTIFRAVHLRAPESQLGHSTIDALFLLCI